MLQSVLGCRSSREWVLSVQSQDETFEAHLARKKANHPPLRIYSRTLGEEGK